MKVSISKLRDVTKFSQDLGGQIMMQQNIVLQLAELLGNFGRLGSIASKRLSPLSNLGGHDPTSARREIVPLNTADLDRDASSQRGDGCDLVGRPTAWPDHARGLQQQSANLGSQEADVTTPAIVGARAASN